MKPTQKRFTTENQIIELIEQKKAQCEELIKEAVALDEAAKQCLRQIQVLSEVTITEEIQLKINQLKRDMEMHRDRAEALSQRRHSIEENKLPSLKRTLAAFQTEPLPFINDKAVTLQR